MKTVLVITYYWPPSGGAGVQRWLKFVKYLPEYGWSPVVYTPMNPEVPADDPSLLRDILPGTTVLKRRICEPYRMYKRFLGMKPGDRINAGFLREKEKQGLKENLSVWVRGNLFIPDARKYWIRPSIRFLKKYLARHPVQAVITSGPPHSMHLVGLGLKKQTGIPWMADFRDPWTDIDFYDQLKLSRRADRKHRELEKAVLSKADAVVVIGPSMAEEFAKLMGKRPHVIPNGFDPDDFNRKTEHDNRPEKEKEADLDPELLQFKERFSILHLGAINRDRNHDIFWKALSELIRENARFRSNLSVVLIGKLDVSVLKSIERYQLDQVVIKKAYIPHNRVASYMRIASLLYLPVNNTPNARSIQTGKLFEYLASEKPILGIGPEEGDAAQIIRECRAGQMIPFADAERLKQAIHEYFIQWDNQNLSISPVNIDHYSRRNLTGKMAELLNQLIGES